MIVRIGVSAVSIARMATLLERRGPEVRAKCFSPAEQAACDERAAPAQHYAARLAAKRAFKKALGSCRQVPLRDVQIGSDTRGAPILGIVGRAAVAASARGVTSNHVSLTHADGVAVALVVLESPARSARGCRMACREPRRAT